MTVSVTEVLVDFLDRAYNGPTPLLPWQLFSESEWICYEGSTLAVTFSVKETFDITV